MDVVADITLEPIEERQGQRDMYGLVVFAKSIPTTARKTFDESQRLDHREPFPSTISRIFKYPLGFAFERNQPVGI
jgi:hypothetical protein